MSATVLVVDDEPVNLDLLAYLLESYGYRVLTARNADDAMTAIGQGRPQLILMDIQLPVVDGYALTRRIKANPDTAGIPVIAVTASAMAADREKALAAGCVGHVSKPIDTRALPDLVARHLQTGGGPA